MLIEPIRTRATARRCVATALPLLTALALPLPAAAQIDPGVNFDSGSPAGKEYAIPIALGRAEGAGTEDQRAAANTPFGVGIKPPGAGQGQGKNAGSGKDGGRRGGATGSGAGADGASSQAFSQSSTTVLTPAMRARLADAEDVGGTTLWTIGAAFLVALAAALLALALRTRPARAAH